MILGDACTRNCAYCAVAHGRPPKYDIEEPERVAQAIAEMGLQHAVITSVDRDDLPDFGAWIFAETIRQIHDRVPDAPSKSLFLIFRETSRASAQSRGRPEILQSQHRDRTASL
jgi:lipoic acid synthetase